jgi:hypothetical protein
VALSALTEAGLTASVAVVVDAIGWDGYLNRGDLYALHAAGWAFVSHSMTHADLTTLSAEDLERERAAVRRHYGAARGATVDWSWPEFVADWRPVDPFGITTIDASFLLRTAEGRAEIMTRVRNAISAGQLLDLMFHDVPTEDVDAFRALVSELASVRHRLFTWADLYPVEG